MYTEVIRSESLLIDKITFIDELMNAVKDQFFTDFRTNG